MTGGGGTLVASLGTERGWVQAALWGDSLRLGTVLSRAGGTACDIWCMCVHVPRRRAASGRTPPVEVATLVRHSGPPRPPLTSAHPRRSLLLALVILASAGPGVISHLILMPPSRFRQIGPHLFQQRTSVAANQDVSSKSVTRKERHPVEAWRGGARSRGLGFGFQMLFFGVSV